MEEQILDAPVDLHKRLDYAGFWIRFAAYFIDGLILWVVNAAIGFVFVEGYSIMTPTLPMQMLSLVSGILYFAFMESSTRQATLGKMAVGIKVCDTNGSQISFIKAVGRYLAKILSGIILGIGFMMAGWDDKKQGLHDKLANTYVYYR